MSKNTFGADTADDVTDWGQENVEQRDRDIDIVDRLRLGGPNAMEVADKAADEIERLRDALQRIAVHLPALRMIASEVAAAHGEFVSADRDWRETHGLTAD